MRRRRESVVSVLAATLAMAAGVLTVVLHARFESDVVASIERRAPGAIAIAGLIGLAVVAAAIWMVLAARPVASMGLAVAATATVAPLWAASSSLGAEVRAAALALPPVAIPGLVFVVVGWRRDAVPRAAWIAVASAVAAVGAHLLGYDPFADLGCTRTCEAVSPLLEGIFSTRTILGLASVGTLVAAAYGVTAMAAVSAPNAIHRSAIVGVVVAAAAVSAGWLAFGDRSIRELVLLIQPAVVFVVGAIVVVNEVRAWRTRRAVRGLADQLADVAARPPLRGGILDVHFAIPGERRWVDADGRETTLPAGSRTIVVVDAAAPVLRFVVDDADERDVSSSLTPARRLSLRNAHLSAVGRARLAEVRASQRRVVAATDAERRRIERDLHDGAQQRLVGVTFQLNIARARLDATSADTVAAADSHVREALARLRDLAHGMFPRILEEEGLVAALEDLVATSNASASFGSGIDGNMDASVAAAAYATVAETLRHAPEDARAHVSLVRADTSIVVRAVVPGASRVRGELVEVGDRVGAAGGTLTVSTEDDVLTVEAVIPCGS